MKKMLLFLVVLCLIVFSLFTYKTLKNGNNINSKTQEEFIDYILNGLKTYEANMNVRIYSNKTDIEYQIKQQVTEEKNMQELLSPENVKGMKIENIGNVLKISNSKLKLEKIYNEFDMVINNSLFLNVFVEDFKNNISKSYEENDEIILETKIENNFNTYAQYKELHINKQDKKIKEMIIKDNNKKTRINIKYNDIEIK